MSELIKKQVKSKSRVADHGEVFTADREVNAMLDLVKQETQRIDSRFLEPACGTGNFLVEIISRKLIEVDKKYKKNQLEFEHYSILAVSSIYGIDLLEDNVLECRKRLFDTFNNIYAARFKKKCKDSCRDSVTFILESNIVVGDALTLQSGGDPIVFPEWSFISSTMVKRRDFVFGDLVSHASLSELPLFSDQGDDVFIPKPVKEHKLTHFLRLRENDGN